MAVGHILCCYRPGARADRALRAASQLALRERAELTIAVVREARGAARACCGMTAGYWDQLLDEADQDDARQAQEIAGSGRVPTRVVILRGPRAPELISDYARDEHCDVIAVPARSLLAGGDALPRRTVRRIRKSAPCEVIELGG
jgi:nucleotide-binding universal stress UspA family protein